MIKNEMNRRTNAGVACICRMLAMRIPQLILLLFCLTACSIDPEGLTTSIPPNELLQSVQMEYNTYNLAMESSFDTVTLRPRGVSATGEILVLPVNYQFDSDYIEVDSNGLVTAIDVVSSTRVIATMNYYGVSQSDTAFISIVANSRKMNRVGLELNNGDSAKISVLASARPAPKMLRIIREDSSNTNVPSLLVSFAVSNSKFATVTQSGSNLSVAPLLPGRVTVFTSTYAYGKVFRDSLEVVIGWPLLASVTAVSRFVSGTTEPTLMAGIGTVRIGMRGCVVWGNPSQELELDIIFDDSMNVFSADSARALCYIYSSLDMSDGKPNSGNISPYKSEISPGATSTITYSNTRSRVFTKPGRYRYYSRIHPGFSGTIVVCDEKNDTTCSAENYKWGDINP